MLLELRIKDFALIDEAELQFGEGLNVISGESGSGKSMVLTALELVLGGRVRSKYFRADTEGWELEAQFQIPTLSEEERALLPDFVEGEELVVSRSMSVSGRSKIYINGKLATLSSLAAAVRPLVHICTQGQSIALLDPSKQLALLDAYAGLEGELEEYRELYDNYKAALKDLDAARARRTELELRREELELGAKELTAVELAEGRREALETEIIGLKRLSKSADLLADVEALCSDRRGGLAGVLSDIRSKLKGLSDPELSASLTENFSALEEGSYQFEQALSAAIQSSQFPAAELEALSDELAEIARLERKYRLQGEALAALAERFSEELAELSQIGQLLASKEAALGELRAELDKKAAALSKARRRAGKQLEKLAGAELAELKLPKDCLRVELSDGSLGPTGADDLKLLFRPNKGEEARELSEIASGGELSRLLLVLQSLVGSRGRTNVLIFDEVDAGVSGRVARAIGRRLQLLSSNNQVLCITHLAQVASLADQHFSVEKNSGKRTRAEVQMLADEAIRIEEIARMLSGYRVTEAARESARELLASNE